LGNQLAESRPADLGSVAYGVSSVTYGSRSGDPRRTLQRGSDPEIPRTRAHRTRPRKDGARLNMQQILQILGAVLILIAYLLAQLRLLNDRSLPYLLLNLAGSAVLAVLAAIGREWGFLLLEGSWAVVSLISLIALTRTRPEPLR
jgi:hypothetical protein